MKINRTYLEYISTHRFDEQSNGWHDKILYVLEIDIVVLSYEFGKLYGFILS